METKSKILIVLLGCILISGLISCTMNSKVKEQEDKLTAQIKSLQASRDSIMSIYLATIDKIDNSLNDVRNQQGNLIPGSLPSSENGISKKEQILNNIAVLNDLLKENKTTIASLQQSLSQFKTGNAQLAQLLKTEKERGVVLEKQISDMKQVLEDKDNSIADLNRSNAGKQDTIEQLTDKNKEQVTALNKTYFTSGTYKQLKEEKIIEKDGGVLGVTAAKVVSKNLDRSNFAVLDMTKDTSIQVAGKNPKIITEHPDGSYILEAKNNELSVLTIKDPENFWKVSKYLVVEVK